LGERIQQQNEILRPDWNIQDGEICRKSFKLYYLHSYASIIIKNAYIVQVK